MGSKVLLLNQFFWPDTAATGQLMSDLVNHISSNGSQVTVICGSAHYGGSTSAPKPVARIIRLRGSSFSRNPFGRIGSYLSFLLGALWQGLRVEPHDVVVTLTTPPLLSMVGLMIQKFRGSRHVIWEMDVYPDIAVDLGVLKPNSQLAKLFGWLADLPRNRADRIMVLGDCMRDRLLSHGIPSNKIVVVENWAEASLGVDEVSPPTSQTLSLLYSGNFGLAHDSETIAHALEILNGRSGNVRCVFAGGGSRHAWIKKFSEEKKLANTEFLPYCERQELGHRLLSASVGLVTQKVECLGSVVPSKTYGIMAAGRPVLFIGPIEATPAVIIKRYRCGWQVDCGDVTGLVRLLDLLSEHPELVAEAGARSHRAFFEHYERSIGVSRIAAVFECFSPEREPQSVRISSSACADSD